MSKIMAYSTTTLSALRKHSACFEGYNKVVRFLQGQEFTIEDRNRKSYIMFRHGNPILLTDILRSNGLDDALWALHASGVSDRDCRLFAVWCARKVQHLMTDHRSLSALDIAERFANGEVTREELDIARAAALSAAEDDIADAAARAAAEAAWDAAEDAAWSAAEDAARTASRAAAWSAAEAAWDAAEDAARADQKEMFIKMCNGMAPWQEGK